MNITLMTLFRFLTGASEEAEPVVMASIVEVLGVFTSPQTLGTMKTIQINGIFKSGETAGKLK